MTGPVIGIRRRRTVAGRRETPRLPPDRDFYGQTPSSLERGLSSVLPTREGAERRRISGDRLKRLCADSFLALSQRSVRRNFDANFVNIFCNPYLDLGCHVV